MSPEKNVTDTVCLERQAHITDSLARIEKTVTDMHNRMFIGNGSSLVSQIEQNSKHRMEQEEYRKDMTKKILWYMLVYVFSTGSLVSLIVYFITK